MTPAELTKISETNAKRIAVRTAALEREKEKERKRQEKEEASRLREEIKDKVAYIQEKMQSEAKRGRKSYTESFFNKGELVRGLEKAFTDLGFATSTTERYVPEDPPCLSDGWGGSEGGWDKTLTISWGKDK